MNEISEIGETDLGFGRGGLKTVYVCLSTNGGWFISVLTQSDELNFSCHLQYTKIGAVEQELMLPQKLWKERSVNRAEM